MITMALRYKNRRAQSSILWAPESGSPFSFKQAAQPREYRSERLTIRRLEGQLFGVYWVALDRAPKAIDNLEAVVFWRALLPGLARRAYKLREQTGNRTAEPKVFTTSPHRTMRDCPLHAPPGFGGEPPRWLNLAGPLRNVPFSHAFLLLINIRVPHVSAAVRRVR